MTDAGAAELQALLTALEAWEGSYATRAADLPRRDRELAAAYQAWRRESVGRCVGDRHVTPHRDCILR